jgi:hypothetical protein
MTADRTPLQLRLDPKIRPGALEQLNLELKTALGFYSPKEGSVLVHPVQTADRWPRATMVHESIHQYLAQNTAFGAFYSFLAVSPPEWTEALDLALAAQWTVQEATATYVGLSVIARSAPDELPDAIALLPTQQLDQPPYREAFDSVSSLLPLEGSDREILRRANLVLAMAEVALNGDILTQFPGPAAIVLEPLRDYLRSSGPDVHFSALVEQIRREPELIESLLRGLGESAVDSGNEDTIFRVALGQIASESLALPVVDNEERMAQSESLLEAWKAYARSSALSPTSPAGQTDSPESELPSVRYRDDWQEEFPSSLPSDESLTVSGAQRTFEEAQQQGHALWGYFAMRIPQETYFGTLPLPLGDFNRPSFQAEAAALYKAFGPPRIGHLPIPEFLDLLEAFPYLPQVVVFQGPTWRMWSEVAEQRRVFVGSVRCAIEHELHPRNLARILEFDDLGTSTRFFVWRVSGSQFAAAICDPDRPGHYVLQGLPGEVSVDLFVTRAEELGLRNLENPHEAVPHVELLFFLSETFLMV